jgi:hypothetical protein
MFEEVMPITNKQTKTLSKLKCSFETSKKNKRNLRSKNWLEELQELVWLNSENNNVLTNATQDSTVLEKIAE